MPLFGDLQIATFSYINKTMNFDASKWPECNNTSFQSLQGNVLAQINFIRNEHSGYLYEFASFKNVFILQYFILFLFQMYKI